MTDSQGVGGTVDGDGVGILVFAARKENGRFAVKGEVGGVAAQISVPWYGSSFTATGPDGGILCRAALGRYGFSSTWRVTGAEGQELLTMRWRWTGSTARVTLHRGGELLLRARLWKPGFTLVDREGVAVVRAEPAAGRRLRRRDLVVRQLQPTLDLAELVAVTQIWRANEDEAAFVAAAG